MKKRFVVDHVDNDLEIILEDTSVEGSLEIKECHITSFSNSRSIFKSAFIIYYSTIKKDLIFHSHCEFNEMVDLYITVGESIGVHNCTFKSGFVIKYGGNRVINLESNTFYSFLHIYAALNETLRLRKNIIHGDFAVDMMSEKSSIYSELNTYHSNLELILINSKKQFESKYDTLKNETISLTANNEESGDFDLIFNETVFERGLRITTHVKGACKKLKSLSITFSQDMGKRILVSDMKIDEIRLTSTNYATIVTLDNITVSQLLMENFYNLSEVNFLKVESGDLEQSKFKIINSHLGKTRLINCNLDSFNNIELINSYISDIVPTSVTWFSDSKLRQIANENLKNGITTSDILRQLRLSCETQGDVPQSLRFKALEYEFFKNELKRKRTRFWDRIILQLSRTNDFGQNWVKPILLFSGLTIIFFLLLALSVSDKITYSPFAGPISLEVSLSEIKNYLYILPQMFNPTRSLERIVPSFAVHNPWIYVIDVLHRIIYAFFIYQTIKAFRKYND